MIGTESELLEFASSNGYEISGGTETTRALRKSNLFMMGLPWLGNQLTGDQSDVFPRKIGEEVFDLPSKVKLAVYLMTCEILDCGSDLNVTGMSSGPKVLSETVTGAVSVTYSEQSLYNEGFSADFMGPLLDKWLQYPISSGRSANMKVDRG